MDTIPCPSPGMLRTEHGEGQGRGISHWEGEHASFSLVFLFLTVRFHAGPTEIGVGRDQIVGQGL